ncbi:S8 family peptidase [Bradyrhizobium zhanjiangense]|uniref:S8 family peptidase n=1 Tax=Bradyrhizobium zhanjiangense TaxID=1325107 RepID=UPI0010088287|nr:S8 family peptidase [Bradyrhizobium zhanjiangense]
MAGDPTKPLLRLEPSKQTPRPTGRQRNIPRPTKFSPAAQNATFGPRFRRLDEALRRDPSGLTLRADQSALAPERLLVFEVRGAVGTFANAIKKVPGLELIDEEELEGDDQDTAPEAYLLVPDAAALQNILTLWKRWTAGQELASGFTPWRDVFATLREIRTWGPSDRVHEEDREILEEEIELMRDDELLIIEIELVFRSSDEHAAAAELKVVEAIAALGGALISKSRIADIAYHALLARLPVPAVRQIVERSDQGISGLDAVMHIRPQSVAPPEKSEDAVQPPREQEIPPANGEPILAILDGVPVSQHPLLRDRLNIDDLFGLEPSALVAERIHGTAMASLIAHGDRNLSELPLPRRIHFVPVLGSNDQFPRDRLVVDLIYRAVTSMRRDNDPTAPSVLIINLSLGNIRKTFQGRLSAWARLIDRLAHKYGILFCVSAGNHAQQFDVPPYSTMMEYEATVQPERGTQTLTALSQLIGYRRLLSPSETVNGITVGSANIDAVSAAERRGAIGRVDPFQLMVTANPSSALGPGFANSVKPDILMPGAREHLTMVASGTALAVRPTGGARPHGLKVAAPPRDGTSNWEHYTCGTSAASALGSRTAHRIHDALEATYGETFISLPHAHRAVILKALLVHTAAWPLDSAELIKSVLGPADPRQHVRQKDNIRRFLGYGIVNAEDAVYCAADRATFWAVGTLGAEQRRSVAVPLPACMSGQALPHSVRATLGWFTPVLPGRQSYRAVKLSLIAPDELGGFRVLPSKSQPDINQASKGTVFSRHWDGDRAPALATNSAIEFVVQREPDRGTKIDELVPFGLAVTIAMPGIVEIYDQARARIAPAVPVRAR